MEFEVIRKMRKRQIVLTNMLLLVLLSIYFTITIVFSFSLSQTNTIVGVLLFLHALSMYIRKDTPKSFIPTFEKVAMYEKEKMGDEWIKQRKTNMFSMFVLSGLMFLNAYITQGTTGPVFDPVTFLPVFILLCIVILVTNVFLFIHIRKVDRSTSKSDFTGYTLHTNVIGVVVGFVIAVIFIFLVIFYVLITS